MALPVRVGPPAFMHQWGGLASLEIQFGGLVSIRSGKTGVTNVWKDAEDDGDLYKPIWRWAEAFQNDWAARADWCVKPWREANHPPIIGLDGAKDLNAAPGATVRLSVRGTVDPDGNKLSYSWGDTANQDCTGRSRLGRRSGGPSAQTLRTAACEPFTSYRK